jgi:Cu/Ag efflux pump CusA
MDLTAGVQACDAARAAAARVTGAIIGGRREIPEQGGGLSHDDAHYRLPIEAYPDVGDVQVDVITLWPGRAAEEVERHITIALKELNGAPDLTFLRSISIFGLSNIRVVFSDGTDKYWARQQVLERIQGAELPPDAKPGLGPCGA